MASVHLDFNPPTDPGMVKLVIWEAADEEASPTVIEEVTAIGDYPNYISQYSTDQAISPNNWFSIEWIDEKEVSTGRSPAVKGGTEKLIAEVVNRAMLRDATLKEPVLYQEAEAVIESFFSTDPYTVDVNTASYKQISGFVSLVMAKTYIQTLIITEAAGANDDYVAGLISQKSGTGSSVTSRIDLLERLIKQANKDLGLNYSVVALMAEVEIAGGQSRLVGFDQSRLLVEID